MVQPKGPYLLVGECHGGAAAYEMAQQLLAGGERVALLVLLDSVRPHPTQYARYRFRLWLGALKGSWFTRAFFHLRQLLRASRGLRLDYLRSNLPKAWRPANQPPVAQPDPVAQYRSQGDHYRRTLYAYRPKPYPGKLTVMANETWHRRVPDLGWSRFAKGGLAVYWLAGDHTSYIREHAATTAARLRECLAACQD
jgi:thioesterase domain-containing protein